MDIGYHSHERTIYKHENELLELMKQRPVSTKEMVKFLQLEEYSADKKGARLNKFIVFISRELPVYSPEPKYYKILTEQDLNDYWNTKRTTLDDLYNEYNTKG